MRARTEENLEFDGKRYKGDSWGQEEEIEVIRKWYGEEEKGMMFPEESLLMRAGGVRDRVLQPAAQQPKGLDFAAWTLCQVGSVPGGERTLSSCRIILKTKVGVVLWCCSFSCYQQNWA